MLTRRQFIQRGAAGAGGVVLGNALLQAGTAIAAPSVASKLTPFVQQLPLPGAGIAVAQQSALNRYAFAQTLSAAKLHPQLKPTQFFAYDDGHGSLSKQAGSFGLAVVARKGTALDMTFTNNLGSSYPDWVPVDTRLTYQNSAQPRTMTHLHGGLVTAQNDGNPVIFPGGFTNGQTQPAHYPNDQLAALLWFHDHGLGSTRLNVFGGLAAAYILRDSNDTGAINNPIGIPGGKYEIPLVIQDRQFQPTPKNGYQNFLYPTSDIPGAVWIGEYFGDVMLVNGVVWPYLNVEPRKYRLRILNGCNARIMSLTIPGVRLWQIGAEGGMFDKPVPVSRLVLAPAERADVIADFSGVAGNVQMINNDPDDPVSTPADSLPTVMQFRVGSTVSDPTNNTVPNSLPGEAASIKYAIAATRYITLNELFAESVDWRLNLNGIPFGDDKYPSAGDPTPRWGTSEEWQFINMTGDTHPMHTHLFSFRVIDRIPFNADAYRAAYGKPVTSATGVQDINVPGGIPVPASMRSSRVAPDPEERGWKDTVKANPGYITRIQMNFDRPSGSNGPESYVHHCHIVEHEDNDMMRPFTVTS
jgi:spore coat protein A, manganese oxidase